MKFLKENWFKVSILILILLCIVLIFLYEVKQQNIEKQNQISNFNTVCQKLATQKKEEINKNDPDLYIGTYEYKYSPIYQSCIVAYTGSYFGNSLSGFLGHNLFKVDNLSTGESIMSAQVNPGDIYKKTNEDFNKMKEKYIGSVLLVE